MKMLVFEYITGGGFNRKELPESLANEGRLMLQALLDSLSAIGALELTVMLDWRMVGSLNLHGFNSIVITVQDDCQRQFEQLAGEFDAVWPVAPESGGILEVLCQTVEGLGKILLTSASSAVALTGNKFLTYQRLIEQGIPTVSTRMLDMSPYNFYPGENIVKPVDGIGCEDSYVVMTREDKKSLPAKLREKGCYIVQPHVHGNKTSLSCLFKEGRSWLLCANLQKFELFNNQYHLSEIIVNYASDLSPYQNLVAKLAAALPDLWGYAGIDLIETTDRILMLEINPRLTTSFAGVEKALGINMASLVLQLLEGDPNIQVSPSGCVSIKINQENHELA